MTPGFGLPTPGIKFSQAHRVLPCLCLCTPLKIMTGRDLQFKATAIRAEGQTQGPDTVAESKGSVRNLDFVLWGL